jgi:hypothetical protein
MPSFLPTPSTPPPPFSPSLAHRSYGRSKLVASLASTTLCLLSFCSFFTLYTAGLGTSLLVFPFSRDCRADFASLLRCRFTKIEKLNNRAKLNLVFPTISVFAILFNTVKRFSIGHGWYWAGKFESEFVPFSPSPSFNSDRILSDFFNQSIDSSEPTSSRSTLSSARPQSSPSRTLRPSIDSTLTDRSSRVRLLLPIHTYWIRLTFFAISTSQSRPRCTRSWPSSAATLS